MSTIQHPYRTHTCSQLREADVGKTVRLAGWIHRVRDHGGIIFVDLRDHYGITQVVIHPDRAFYRESERWRLETTVSFTGTVVRRSEETLNPTLDTGTIELEADAVQVLGECDTLPFQVAVDDGCGEELRLRHRFLDLRRSGMHDTIVLRSRVVSSIRRRLTDLGFTEFQTPILTKSSPEGARDYLVPSRVHPGTFYALPQAPQLFKQLLMISGFDRYFQIAPCFRDEDARADRSPGEFYQVDLEMAFATQDDVFAAVEALFAGLFDEFCPHSFSPIPFQRIAYHDAMLLYGTDKPDLRIPLEIMDVTDLFRESAFNAFRQVVQRGGVVRALPVRGAADRPRSFFDGMIEFVQQHGGKGLAYICWTDEGPKSPILKFLSDECVQALARRGDMHAGDVMFFVADTQKKANRLAGEVRIRVADLLDLSEQNTFEFCWIVDYPLFEFNEDSGRIDFSHNPFSMPQGGMDALVNDEPENVKGFQYDLVCNGVELSSGAIRNHRPDIMLKAFEIAGYTRQEVEEKFGGLLNALRYGPPPHGGIAPGLERIVMLLTGARNIRDVTAFPMNQSAQDLLLGAPGEVSEKQLKELHIRPVTAKQKAGK
ncbi:MAG: aspartate--tRNA ligase [Candidatus Pacebacteria bacterium]|nr:aspartate--tRNA ligase [Candidatus Paceibacterota bacterium]